MGRINSTTIANALTKAQTAIREYAQAGGKRVYKSTGLTENVTVSARGTWNNKIFGMNNAGRELVEVERRGNKQVRDMVTERDIFVSTKNGNKIKKLLFSQFMSKTGEARIFPAKKGFLGIGKKEGYIEVVQSNSRSKTLNNWVHDIEDITLTANGTLENPINCILHVGDKQIMLSAERAKDFIKQVKDGYPVDSSLFLPANLKCLA